MPPSSPAADTRLPSPRWLVVAPWAFLALWSGGYTPVKIGLQSIEPIFYLAVRYAGVLAILVPAYVIVRPQLPRSRAEWGHLMMVGFLIQGIYFTLTNLAIGAGASAAGLGIILALQPILVALAAPRFAGEQVGLKAWAGLLLGLAGVAIVVMARTQSGSGTWTGMGLAGIAVLCIAAGTLWEKRFGVAQNPIVANIVQCGVGLVLSLGLALLLETCRITWSWPFALSLGYLVVGNSIIAMTLLLAMIRHGQASRVSALLFLVPPCSAVIAWAILDEPLPPVIWLGMLLAGAGVALVGPARAKS